MADCVVYLRISQEQQWEITPLILDIERVITQQLNQRHTNIDILAHKIHKFTRSTTHKIVRFFMYNYFYDKNAL